jgi:hypothetical protein
MHEGLGQLCAYKAHFAARKSILYLYGPMRRPRVIEDPPRPCFGAIENNPQAVLEALGPDEGGFVPNPVDRRSQERSFKFG